MKPSTFPQHPKFDWLRFCSSCKRYHDIEDFNYPTDTECAAQHRRLERIREGLINYSDLQSSGTKAGIKRRIKNREAADEALSIYKRARQQQLLDEGVQPWDVWSALQADLAVKLEELGVPPA